MKKLFGLFTVVFLLGIIVLTGCRPPEVEGVVVNMQHGLYDKAFDLAKEAVQKYPNDPEAWYLLGTLYARQEDYVHMNEAFDKSLAISPKFADQIKKARFEYFAQNYNDALKNYYNRGIQEQDPVKRKKLFEKAAEKFKKAYQADPTRVEPLVPLATSFLQIGDTTQAINFMDKAVNTDRVNDTLLVTVGDFFFRIGNVEKAKTMYLKALDLNPNDSMAHLSLGEIYAKEKNWDKAIEHFKKGMELEPKNASVPLNVGVIYYNNEKYKEAIPFLKKSLELNPDNKDAAELLSICYLQTAQPLINQYNETNDMQKKAELKKKFMAIYDEALPFLQNAVKKFPDSSLLWNNLGVIYAQEGNKEKAQEAFDMQKKLEEGGKK